jgi:acetyl-CoA carboxylase biotin carboxyl carrier protein
VYELRSAVTASVRELVADEGQLIAEGDEVAILEASAGEVVVVTEVPGVVRELHVEPGDMVEVGSLIALIDES